MVRAAVGVIASGVMWVAASAAVVNQGPPLRIAVLAGEDSVNVIQQKTAVAPLVEVRDRNNNPVSGALVTFAVQGGKSASFQGGVSTITVATNAAGQAAATGFTPLTAGAVNISVEAAFQGQIVTAAISQVNVLTAAEAAAVAGGASGAGSGSGSAAGGGAAGGGGGLSATTIAVVGGIAAAGAVAGTQVLGRGDVYRGTFSSTATINLGGCARTDTLAGTLVIELDATGGSISGHGEIRDGSGQVTASTCPGVSAGPIGDGRWGMPDGPVSGTESSLRFESRDNVQSLQPGVRLDRTFTFLGALSGSTITGQIEMVWIPVVPNPIYPIFRTTITLSKQ